MSRGIVVLTSSPGAFPGLTDALRNLAVTVEEHPLLSFAPPLDWAPLDQAIREIDRFRALAVTSPRAAAAFAGRWREAGQAGARLPPMWCAGRSTAAALDGLKGEIHLPSEEAAGGLGAAAALAAAMLKAGAMGPVLFPCGELRRDELPTRLRHESVEVEEVICYRTVLADESAARAAAQQAEILVVASPGVAGLLARVASPEARPRMLAVGPTTAAAARASGWQPAAVAAQPDVPALLAGVRSLLSSDAQTR